MKSLGAFSAIVVLALLNVSCAGPVSPFGSVDLTAREVAPVKENLLSSENVKVSFFPKKQLFHGKTNFKIKVTAPGKLASHKMTIFHNSYNVTKEFMKFATVKKDLKSAEYTFKKLKLPANRMHDIRVMLELRTGEIYVTSYDTPECPLSERKYVYTTGTFKPSNEVLDLIEKYSIIERVNPAFLTALIAQESSFDRKAVSWSKAIGLTQITPIAERQIASSFENWPRNVKINKLPVPLIKSKILLGEYNQQNEWRLNSRYSIQGGIAYLKFLNKYWNSKQKRALLNENKIDFKANFTSLILASYNSGPFRVSNSVRKLGPQWLKNNNLNEARIYVNKIKSYCYHFSNLE